MDLEILAGSLRLGAAVWLLTAAARRWTPRLLPGGRRSFSESFLRAALVATFFIITSVALLGALGLLNAWALLLVAAALYGAALALPSPADDPPGVRLRMGPRHLAPLAPALALLAVDLAVFLPSPPVNWDAMTYHLYFPARWLQEGRLFHIPTVFSDNSAAFAPQNGALFFAWQMALLGRDATTNVSQVLGLLFAAAAVYRMALTFGLRRQPALMAAAVLVWLSPLRRWAYTANVDVFMLAFWTGAVYWLLAYTVRRERGSAVACGLAAGLAAGTKTVGLPLTALPAAVFFVVAARGRRWRDLGGFAAAATAAGGWWYLKNLWLYGNPLFPLDVSLLGLRLPGAYTAETLRQSLFRIAELDRWLEVVGASFGLTTCVLLLAGFFGVAWMAFPGRGRRPLGRRRWIAALALAAFSVAWAGYVFAVVPHNNQTRFLIPVLVVSLLGLAHWLHVRYRRRVRYYVLAIGLAAVASRPHLEWAYHHDRLAAAGVDTAAWAVLTALVLAAAAWAAWRWQESRRWPFAAVGWAVVWPAVALAAHHGDQSRMAFLAQADYRVWRAGYLMFNDPALAPQRIAYSGVNVPYALAGPGWKHRVAYCNTQGREDDGFYDFWARDPRRYPTHKPGLYRGDDDFDVWWACLERRRVDTVVLFATLPVERPRHWPLSGDFPVEREWMRQRSELFEPVLLTAKTEIYRVTATREQRISRRL